MRLGDLLIACVSLILVLLALFVAVRRHIDEARDNKLRTYLRALEANAVCALNTLPGSSMQKRPGDVINPLWHLPSGASAELQMVEQGAAQTR